jgi:hypothetical protein
MKNMNCVLYRMPAMHYNTILMQELEDISYKTIKLIPITMLLLKSVLKIQEKDIVKYYLLLIKFQQIKSANIITLLILSAVESIAWNIRS